MAENAHHNNPRPRAGAKSRLRAIGRQRQHCSPLALPHCLNPVLPVLHGTGFIRPCADDTDMITGVPEGGHPSPSSSSGYAATEENKPGQTVAQAAS